MILAGTPVGECADGSVRRARVLWPAFAVCTAGGAPGGLVAWDTETLVERGDWSALTGVRYLNPRSNYYLSGNGMLATVRSEQLIGVARSNTVLRVSVAWPEIDARLLSVTGTPLTAFGAVGDFVYDAAARAFWGPKTAAGWGQPSYLVGASALTLLNGLASGTLSNGAVVSGSGPPTHMPSVPTQIYLDAADGGRQYEWFGGAWTD